MTWRPPFQRLLLASSPLCFCTNEHRRVDTDLGCRACDRHLPMAILVCHVLGRLSRQFRRFSSRVPPCAFQSELPAAHFSLYAWKSCGVPNMLFSRSTFRCQVGWLTLETSSEFHVPIASAIDCHVTRRTKSKPRSSTDPGVKC